jgi:hypothetical protein
MPGPKKAAPFIKKRWIRLRKNPSKKEVRQRKQFYCGEESRELPRTL